MLSPAFLRSCLIASLFLLATAQNQALPAPAANSVDSTPCGTLDDPYRRAVLTDRPFAWYRLREASGDVAHDCAEPDPTVREAIAGSDEGNTKPRGLWPAKFEHSAGEQGNAGTGLVAASPAMLLKGGDFATGPHVVLPRFPAKTGPFADPEGFSIELWVKWIAGPGYARIFSSSVDDSGKWENEIALLEKGNTPALHFMLRDKPTIMKSSHFGWCTDYPDEEAMKKSELPNGSPSEWTHVILTVATTPAGKVGMVTKYYNGSKVSSTDCTKSTVNMPESGVDVAPTAERRSSSIGGSAGSPLWTGAVAEVALYTTVLSSNRAAAHFKAATAPPVDLAAERLAWIADQRVGAIINGVLWVLNIIIFGPWFYYWALPRIRTQLWPPKNPHEPTVSKDALPPGVMGKA